MASGIGCSYYLNGNKDYEGVRVMGLADGKGKSYYEESGWIEYEGDWKNGETGGKGVLYYDKEDHINQENSNDSENSVEETKEKGKEEKGNKTYEGNWKEGLYEGHGVEWYNTKEIKHSGMWKDGMPVGL